MFSQRFVGHHHRHISYSQPFTQPAIGQQTIFFTWQRYAGEVMISFKLQVLFDSAGPTQHDVWGTVFSPRRRPVSNVGRLFFIVYLLIVFQTVLISEVL